MNKKKLKIITAHTIVCFFEVFIFWRMWHGYAHMTEVFTNVKAQIDTVTLYSRCGVYVVGIGFPLIHGLVIIENIRPSIRRHLKIINRSIVVLIIALIVIAFGLTAQVKTHVENAGYVFCYKTYARYLVYARSNDLCEEAKEAER
jgi:surface polysaccharide O-acyltransferase-like enzyme